MAKELLSTRPIDKLGRIVIPMELRKELGWRDGDRIGVCTRGIDVLLSKSSSNCAICEGRDNLNKVKGKLICDDCKSAIVQLEFEKNDL